MLILRQMKDVYNVLQVVHCVSQKTRHMNFLFCMKLLTVLNNIQIMHASKK